MKLSELNKRIKEDVFVGCIAEDIEAFDCSNQNRFCKVSRINGDECWEIWYEELDEAENGINPNETYEMCCNLERMKLVVK